MNMREPTIPTSHGLQVSLAPIGQNKYTPANRKILDLSPGSEHDVADYINASWLTGEILLVKSRPIGKLDFTFVESVLLMPCMPCVHALTCCSTNINTNLSGYSLCCRVLQSQGVHRVPAPPGLHRVRSLAARL